MPQITMDLKRGVRFQVEIFDVTGSPAGWIRNRDDAGNVLWYTRDEAEEWVRRLGSRDIRARVL